MFQYVITLVLPVFIKKFPDIFLSLVSPLQSQFFCMTFSLLRFHFFFFIYDLWPPPYCWHCSFMLTVYILSPGGAHRCPSQSTSFWTTSCCTTNRLLTSCSVCVCVICWFMYWVDLVTMEMVAWWLEVTQYVLLNIYIILYLVTNCYRIFFFLNDSWIRNNKWSWLLYLLCWLFFYMTEASRSNLGPTWGNITKAWFGSIVL